MKRFLLSLTLLLTTAGIAFAQSVTVNKIWLEHGVTQNDQKGLRVHIEVELDGYKGFDMRAIAYFESPKGVGHKDLNNRYRTADGNVSASKKFSPRYDNSIYNDLKIFIPLSELHLKEGKYTYYCVVQIYGPNGYCASSDYVSFEGTGSANNNANNQASKYAQKPAYGSLNGTVYMQDSEHELNIIKMEFYTNGNQQMMRCDHGSISKIYMLVDSDEYVYDFRECQLQAGFGFNNVSWRPSNYGHLIVIMKDWSRAGYNQVFACDTHITAVEYERIKKIKDKFINSMQSMSGGYNGGYNSGYSGSSHQHNHEGSSHRDERCKYCGGGGGCSSCNGKGYKFNPYSGENDTCPSCNGSGRCFNCHGTGKQAIY